MFKWFKNLLSAGTSESSKRFCMVLSYLASFTYAGACIFFGFPLENNVLTLLLGALSGSTAGYVFASKNEIKKTEIE
jgi:hypothetical protein